MTIEIKSIKTSGDLKRFIAFPFSLYGESTFWVPPMTGDEKSTLLSSRNPAFDYCSAKYWLAFRDEIPVGRVAGIINEKYNEKHRQRTARFSRLDFVDDPEVSGILLRTAEDWSRSQGMEKIYGPLGFNTFDHYGILTQGFEELPTIASTYNHAYYPAHLERHGYGKDQDYVEHLMTVPDSIPEKYQRVAAMIKKRYGFKLYKAESKKEIMPLGKEVFRLFNTAYEHLAYTTPLTEREISGMVKKYFPFLDLKYIYLAMDKDDKLAGVCVAMPSLSRAFQKARGRLLPFGVVHLLRALKKHDIVDLLLVGVLPKYLNKGITALFNYEYSKTCREQNVKFVESNTVMEENMKVNAHWDYYESRQHKRKRVYVKELK